MEFLLMDWRSAACFIHSRQLDTYVRSERHVNLSKILREREKSPLMNDTDFEWADTLERTNKLINGGIPVGADPVMYLLFKVYCYKEEELTGFA